jgi:hypothetical protein
VNERKSSRLNNRDLMKLTLEIKRFKDDTGRDTVTVRELQETAKACGFQAASSHALRDAAESVGLAVQQKKKSYSKHTVGLARYLARVVEELAKCIIEISEESGDPGSFMHRKKLNDICVCLKTISRHQSLAITAEQVKKLLCNNERSELF